MSDRLVAVFSPFENLTDPRIERTRRHESFDLVVVSRASTIAGADAWTDIERFGRAATSSTGGPRFCDWLVVSLLMIRLAACLPGSIRQGW